MTTTTTTPRRAARRALAGALAAALAAAVPACSSILDVDNPNNIPEEGLLDAASANQQANGVLAATLRMYSALATPYGVATDEFDWIGSRDAWLDIDRGAVSNYLNEFTDQAFPFVGEARYLADETIERFLTLRENPANVPNTTTPLAKTYLYGAMVYSSVADVFDDFAISEKETPGPAIGRANMAQLYDTAIDYLDEALVLTAATSAEQRYRILATRARVKHARAVWQKITPGAVQTGLAGLVNDAGANQDALDALAISSANATVNAFRLVANRELQPGINVWFEVNGRNEHRVGTAFRTGSGTTANYLDDPISGTDDATAKKMVEEFVAAGSVAGFHYIVDNRELQLILAEAALAAGNMPEFTTRINAARAFDSKTPYAGQIPALDLLKHERRVHLFNRMRRLADLYRFGEREARWAPVTGFDSAYDVPGLLFPIPNVERLANPCIEDPSGCAP